MPQRLGRSRNRGRGRSRGRARGRRGIRRVYQNDRKLQDQNEASKPLQERWKSPTVKTRSPKKNRGRVRKQRNNVPPVKRKQDDIKFKFGSPFQQVRSRSRHNDPPNEFRVRRDFDWADSNTMEDKSRSYSDVTLGSNDLPAPKKKPQKSTRIRLSPERSPELFCRGPILTRRPDAPIRQFEDEPMHLHESLTSWENVQRKRPRAKEIMVSDRMSTSDEDYSSAETANTEGSEEEFNMEQRVIDASLGIYKEKNSNSWRAFFRTHGIEYRSVQSGTKRRAKECSNWLCINFSQFQVTVPNPREKIRKPKRVEWFSYFQGRGRHAQHGFFGGPIFRVPVKRRSLVLHLIPKLKQASFRNTQVSVAPLNRNRDFNSPDTLIAATGRKPKRKEDVIRFILNALQRDHNVCFTVVNLLIPSHVTIDENIRNLLDAISCTIQISDHECEFLPNFREARLKTLTTKNLFKAVCIVNMHFYQGEVSSEFF